VVVTTNGLGLGLKTNVRITFAALSDSVDGFLEFITEELFDQLTMLQYRSLYTYIDPVGIRQFCVLFGPLSLINSSHLSRIGFSNTDDDGEELKWRMYYTYGYNFDYFDEDDD